MSTLGWTVLLLSVVTAFWLLGKLFQSFKDISPLALKQQSNIATVRKANETAHYRNFLVPNGFPLTTGLALSNQYKIRNGNIGDVWSAIVANNTRMMTFNACNENSRETYNIAEINGFVKKIMGRLKTFSTIGVFVSIDTLPGFATYIALMLLTIKVDGFQFYILNDSQLELESNLDFDLIIIDDKIDFTDINHISNIFHFGNKKKMLSQESELSHKNLIYWTDIITDCQADTSFKYEPNQNNSDDLKAWCNIITDGKDLTRFIQLNLVSAIANYVKSFPMDHELNDQDLLTIVTPNSFNKSKKITSNDNLQNWVKIFAVLLHGGSVQFTNNNYNNFLKDSTLLSIHAKDFLQLIDTLNYKPSLLQKWKLKSTTLLFDEGIFFNNKYISNVRCIYLNTNLNRLKQISKFSKKIKPYSPGQCDFTFSTGELNKLRSMFGCRIITELYVNTLILGPISATNFFDYRKLPEVVEEKVNLFGALSTSLEGKFIEADGFDITQRQGMLCVRGFTIGKPLDDKRLEKAIKSSKSLAKSEGWMPLMGVYGLWGHDGCLYLYK